MSGAGGGATVREVLLLLRRWQVRVVAGEAGLGRPVNWASTMRARLPAFEGFQGGELALLSLTILRSLRGQAVGLTLPEVVDQLVETGAAAIAVAGLESAPSADEPASAFHEACVRADLHGVALLALPAPTPLADVEREVIAHVVARRGRPARAAEPLDAAHLRASLRAEALEALLSGTYVGEAQMLTRAAHLGYDLAQPHAVLWVTLDPHPLPLDGHTQSLTHSAVAPARPNTTAAARLVEALEVGFGAWANLRTPTPATPHGTSGQHTGHAGSETDVMALLPLSGERGFNASINGGERVAALLVRLLGAAGTNGEAPAWAAGLGEPATAPAQVRRSATEAHDAARLGLMILGPACLARPADLGVYRLLLALRTSGELVPFVEHALAPLLAAARNGDALVETLDAFFACNGNHAEAARRLHLHRNSLLYRLQRATDLLEHDLDDPELRLTLQLAIKGRRVLGL